MEELKKKIHTKTEKNVRTKQKTAKKKFGGKNIYLNILYDKLDQHNL